MSAGRRVLGAIVALALVGLALGSEGCRGSDTPPPGFVRFADHGLLLDYPAAWRKEDVRMEAGGEAAGTKLNIVRPSHTSGVNLCVTLFGQKREYPDIAKYGKDAARTRPFALPEGRAVSDGPLSVPGASDGGWTVTTDFFSEDSKRRRLPARLVDVLALRGKEQFRLSIAGPRDEVEHSPEIAAIRKSLRVG